MLGQRRQIIRIVGVALPGCRRKSIEIVEWVGNAEDHPLLGAIWIERADYLTARVIEHRRLLAELRIPWGGIIPSFGKERLKLLDHAALVVVDLPPADHHTVCDAATLSR